MFTGIVQCVGEVVEARSRGAGMSLAIAARFPKGSLSLGDSVAVEGACLTVTSLREGVFTVDASAQTLAMTTVGSFTAGVKVNLEQALTLSTPLGGHLVSGHVDGRGRLEAVDREGDFLRWTVSAPPSLMPFVADKGSVALNGVSLTVIGLNGDLAFDLMLIPHTIAATSLVHRRVGDAVNLEADLLARYVARLLQQGLAQAGDASPDRVDWAGLLSSPLGSKG